MFEKQIEMLCHIGLFKFAPLNPKKRFLNNGWSLRNRWIAVVASSNG